MKQNITAIGLSREQCREATDYLLNLGAARVVISPTSGAKEPPPAAVRAREVRVRRGSAIPMRELIHEHLKEIHPDGMSKEGVEKFVADLGQARSGALTRMSELQRMGMVAKDAHGVWKATAEGLAAVKPYKAY